MWLLWGSGRQHQVSWWEEEGEVIGWIKFGHLEQSFSGAFMRSA